MSMGMRLISMHDLEDRIGCRDCLLVDLRDPLSYAAGHVKGAVNLPFGDYDRWRRTLPRNKIIVLYCERGGAAMQAGRELLRAGYRVEVVSGGYRVKEKKNGLRAVHPDRQERKVSGGRRDDCWADKKRTPPPQL